MKLTRTFSLIGLLLLAAFLTVAMAKDPPPPSPPSTPATSAAKLTFTLGDLVSAQPSLMKLFNADLPIKTSWSLRKTVQMVEAELKRYEEQRQALVKKYAGSSPSVPADRMDSFLADIRTLQAIKVELEVTPIPLSILGESVKFTPVDMIRLERFVLP